MLPVVGCKSRRIHQSFALKFLVLQKVIVCLLKTFYGVKVQSFDIVYLGRWIVKNTANNLHTPMNKYMIFEHIYKKRMQVTNYTIQ